MSIINSILKIFNMKDSNLIFNENFVEERQIKDKRCLVFLGYLKNDFEFCQKCGCINENTIIKKGTRNSLIKINKHAELTTYLDLTKQIYKCKNCNRKFYATTTEADYRCHISKQVKLAVFNCAKEVMSKKLIAKLYNICDNTFQKVFDTQFNHDTLYKNYIPEAICIDEFTYKKKTFAFNICDAVTGKTFDIVEDRTTSNLDKYFSYYSEEARNNVNFVVKDMYSPYIDLIKKWLPNAKIIIDLFHIVQLLTKSLNKTRINVMKKNKEDHNKFKNYWRLILKSRFDLDNGTWRKFKCFKELMTEIDVINYLLNKEEFFENSYNLYQDILYYLQHREHKMLVNVFEEKNDNISEQMKTALNTLKKYSSYIKNTLEYSYSNGVMERNNNTCKLLKRISFGYRNFKNMKSRIMIVTNVFRKEKRDYQTKYSNPIFA